MNRAFPGTVRPLPPLPQALMKRRGLLSWRGRCREGSVDKGQRVCVLQAECGSECSAAGAGSSVWRGEASSHPGARSTSSSFWEMTEGSSSRVEAHGQGWCCCLPRDCHGCFPEQEGSGSWRQNRACLSCRGTRSHCYTRSSIK